MTEETKNDQSQKPEEGSVEDLKEATPFQARMDQIVNVPLSLFKQLVADYAFMFSECLTSEDVVCFGDLFEHLAKEWVVIYEYISEDGDNMLGAAGFDTKAELSEFLIAKYAREIEVDGIKVVLEGGRPRRFKVDVTPRIGF